MDTSRINEARAPDHRRRAQVTMARWKYKEIIFAVLHVQEMQNERRNDDGSPVGPPDYEYTLDVSYHPCRLSVLPSARPEVELCENAGWTTSS